MLVGFIQAFKESIEIEDQRRALDFNRFLMIHNICINLFFFQADQTVISLHTDISSMCFCKRFAEQQIRNKHLQHI